MKRLLFVCVENSCRSQMAEAFARLHGGDDVLAYSAGSKASGRVNPRAIQVMQEVGYDLSEHESKSLDEVPPCHYDAVITMGCGDSCPYIEAETHEDWGLADPARLPLDEFKKVRDEIETKVKDLLARVSEHEVIHKEV